ncbi:hypothetical protein ACQKIE_12065 [Luteibacter sp. NPDC031894]|uniref:hypothetical protein n=1 Tax=Luteibacter sp. NPDC031894 TaxID=3390572 RepID=UPI003CFE4064
MKKILKLDRDNIGSGDYWILVDGETVYLSEQRKGCDLTAAIAIPKEHFDKLIDFYNADQAEE